VVSLDTGLPQVNAIQLRDLTGVWSGTTSGNWNDNDTTSQNFSGQNYTAVKAATSDVYFGDKDASGNAVATTTVTLGAGGVTGVNVNFNNNALAYTLNSTDAAGITGAYGLTLNGPGTVTLNGANTYTGNTTLNAGRLVLSLAGSVGGSAALVFNGGTLDASALSPSALTLNSGQALRGAGTVSGSLTAAVGDAMPSHNWTLATGTNFLAVSSGSSRIVVASGQNTTVSASLQGRGFEKVGAGTLTLSGTSTYTGATEVRAGTLAVSGTLGNTALTVLSNATLQVDGTIGSSAVAVQSGGRLTVGAAGSVGSASLTIDGLLDVTAAGGYFSLVGTLAGSGVVTGGVTMASRTLNPGPVGGAGTLLITNGSLAVYGGTLAFDLSNIPATGNDLLVVNGNQLELVVSAVPSLTWTGDGAGNLWDIGTSSTWLNGATPSTYADGNSVTFNNVGGTNPVVNIPGLVAPSAVTVSGSSNYSFTGAGGITGGAALLKSGTGTLTVLNNNTFVGNVFLSGGTLAIGNAGANGSLAANITNSAALVITTPLDQTVTNSISGPGSFTKLGAGVLTLTAASTLTGPTTIGAGTLALGDGSMFTGVLGSGPVTNNATLLLSQAASFTLSNAIRNNGGIVNLSLASVTLAGAVSGSGALTNSASATLFVSASNSYSGGTFINQGTVFLNDFAGLGVGRVGFDDFGGGTLSFLANAGTTNVLANPINLPAATTQQFKMPLNASVSSAAFVRLTGVISGGAAGAVTRFVDSGNATINAVTLVLENAANSFTTIPEVFRGTLAFTSDGALGNPTNALSVNAAQNGAQAPPLWTGKGLQFGADNLTLNAGRNVQLVGSENIDVQAFTGTIAGPVTGVGPIKLGAGTLRLTGSGSLSGQTTLSNGTLRVDCQWTGSSLVAMAGTTLMGTGMISAPITIQGGAALSPGASLGTLTVSSNLTLAAGSSTLMEINAASITSDQVAGLATLNYGGTLTVTNAAGSLAAGQTFHLFSATNYARNFAATNLPALGAGLAWQWTPTSGTLAVVASVATHPTNLTAVVSGGNLNLSWPADHTGWRLEVQTNSLSVGVANNWVTWPGSDATNAVSVPINPATCSSVPARPRPCPCPPWMRTATRRRRGFAPIPPTPSSGAMASTTGSTSRAWPSTRAGSGPIRPSSL
jgi:autotransporter-associated beta strand protein